MNESQAYCTLTALVITNTDHRCGKKILAILKRFIYLHLKLKKLSKKNSHALLVAKVKQSKIELLSKSSPLKVISHIFV